MVWSLFSPFCDRSCVMSKWQILIKKKKAKQSNLGDRMIKQLLNSVRLPQNIVICQCLSDHLRLRQIIDLLANANHDILLNLV